MTAERRLPGGAVSRTTPKAVTATAGCAALPELVIAIVP
jgi:hypothetical protein